jgi:FtsZ-binding cell division protein ZapB
MVATIDQLTKGIMAVIYQVALLQSEVSTLHKANEALSKRWKAKRTRIQLGGALTIQDVQDLLD